MQPPARSSAQTLPILWAAFVSTHLMLLGISFVVPAAPVGDVGWVPLLGLLAVVPAGLSVSAGLFARAAKSAQTWFILRFALAEAASLFGFVAYFVSGDHLVQLGCAALGILAHLMAFPSAAAQAAFAERG